MWAIADENHENRMPTHGYEVTRQALCRRLIGAGAKRRDRRVPSTSARVQERMPYGLFVPEVNAGAPCTAVDTANPLSGDGISIDVEYIPSRRLGRGDPD
jgi:hypothetical protein